MQENVKYFALSANFFYIAPVFFFYPESEVLMKTVFIFIVSGAAVSVLR